MPRRSGTRIEDIALERNLITTEQLEHARKTEDGTESAKPIGLRLVALGYLTANQLISIMDEQWRRANESEERGRIRNEDILLGKFLQKNLRATESEIGEALQPIGPQTPAEVGEHLSDPAHVVGEFVLVSPLGRGGTGEVWKSWDRELGRWVAVKILTRPESRVAAERFQREAQAAARLTHPNIVPIYRVAEHQGRPYLVMQLVEGRPLGEWRLPLRRAVEVMNQVALAAHYAHEQGVVHRDLKPGNILLNEKGGVWVLDFGLAHVSEIPGNLTAPGTLLGTPAYMSPEQAPGGAGSHHPATDVYSLGATFYELVTGHAPFEAETVFEMMDMVRTREPVSPRRLIPRLPADVETVILKAMEKVPGRRYKSAREFAEDLRRYLAGEPIHARPAGRLAKGLKWSRRHPVVSAVAGMVLASGILLAAVLAAGAARFQGEIRDLEGRARVAEESRRFAEAEELYVRIKMLMPHHPTAAGKTVEMRLTVQAESLAANRRAAARTFLDEGRRAQQETAALLQKLEERRDEEKRIASKILPYEGEEKKRSLWDLHREIEELEDRVAVRHTDIIVAFTSALAIDPDSRLARAALAEIYYSEFERAERESNPRDIKVNEKLVRLFDEETYLPLLRREGTIEIDSNPPGAEVHLLKYEEGPDRRLVASPVRSLGLSPIPATKLDGGSYLLIMAKPGYRDVRYPVLIQRGSRHSAKVNLYTESQIGTGFIYVPGGPFIMGEDKRAYSALDPEKERPPDPPGDFFIAEFELSCDEYRVFIEDLASRDLNQARRRVPRDYSSSEPFWEIDGAGKVRYRMLDMGTLPVMGISWDDAHVYCEWMTRRAKARGEGVSYRLPTNVEWEKAARGVDGRPYPWGHHFDWTFTHGALSKNAIAQPGPIGAFEKDASVYGVRDMAGSMREWCEDWQILENSKHMRGGSWTSSGSEVFRLASRSWGGQSVTLTSLGVRLVRILRAP